MPDELRSPIKHHLVLHRHDPEQGMARFYSLMVGRDLFGRVMLVQYWGRINAKAHAIRNLPYSAGEGSSLRVPD